jgi:DNA-directed RNA polymerase specialized sigma24 family protein
MIMKTNSTVLSRNVLSDEQLIDDLDDLVVKASQGDRRAIGAIAVAFGPRLLDEAIEVLGRKFADQAADVLQDFFLSLCEGRTRFVPARGRALPWMFGIVRAAALKTRADRHVDWGLDEDPG